MTTLALPLRASERRSNGEIVIRDSASHVVGTVVQMQGAEHAAMVADLWVAAPELLAVVEAMARCHCLDHTRKCPGDATCFPCFARKALAKARPS